MRRSTIQNNHSMKKLLLLLLLTLGFINQQALSEEWIVMPKENLQYLPLMEVMKANSNQEWEVNASTYPSDAFILGSHMRAENGKILINTGMNERETELFLFDCEFEKCLMEGTVDFDFVSYWTGFDLQPIFNLKSFNISTSSTAKPPREIRESVIGTPIFHEQPIKYIDRNLIYFHWDPQDTWYPETITVLLNWESRSEQRSFIAECYETCFNLKVYGEITFDYGDLKIKAHKLEKVE